MWRLLSLNKKILIFLVAVQSIVLLFGVFGLIHWMEVTRKNDLYNRVDEFGDVMEDMIDYENNHWVFHNRGEFATDLDRDRLVYFELQDENNQAVIQSDNISSAIRNHLHKKLFHSSPADEEFISVKSHHSHWIFQAIRIKKNYNGVTVYSELYVGVNVEDAFEEIERLRDLSIFVFIVALFLTALGSYLVLAYSTRNLRRFAQDIRHLRPPYFAGKIEMLPQSAEEQLLFDSYTEMVNTLRTSIESQRLFITNASHELKTPIAAALSALEVTLSKPRSAEDYENTCRDVLTELQMLKRLSNALLEMAKLDEDKTDHHESCKIDLVISQVFERWKKPADDKGIRLEVNLPEQACNTIPGSAEEWEVIIGNLVDNAIKYGRTNGHVWISVKEILSDVCEISIRDDGMGMSEDEIAQLGKIFYKADAARSGKDSFGVGFAHAKRLVEHLGGSLAVHQAGEFGINSVISLKQTPLM